MTVISILEPYLTNKAEPTALYKINNNVHIKTSKIRNYIVIIIVFLTHHTIPHQHTNMRTHTHTHTHTEAHTHTHRRTHTHTHTHTHRRNATRGEAGEIGEALRRHNLKPPAVLFVELFSIRYIYYIYPQIFRTVPKLFTACKFPSLDV